MNLIQRVSTGIILVSGLLPSSLYANWFGTGCNSCGQAPMAPMFTQPMMAPMAFDAPACGPQQCGMPGHSRRLRRPPRHHRRHRCAGAEMYSDPTMGLGMGMGDCGCGSAPMMQPQVMLQPQQFTTYVEVPRTVMRQEAVQVQVPTTTYQQVAVDEGGYQQVWVPRMVTKNVPQTVMQTQVQYRQVPQTVVERVPQMSTQWIPSQTVMGVPTIAPGSAYRPTYAMGTPSYPIATPTTVTPVPEYNSPAPFNRVPTPVVPQTSQVQEWQKVRQRTSTIEQQKYEIETETPAAAAVEAPPAGYLVPKAVGRFSSKR